MFYMKKDVFNLIYVEITPLMHYSKSDIKYKNEGG